MIAAAAAAVVVVVVVVDSYDVSQVSRNTVAQGAYNK